MSSPFKGVVSIDEPVRVRRRHDRDAGRRGRDERARHAGAAGDLPGAVLATWVAGVNLAKATDQLDDRYGLGEALGGMILLSVAGSLPELAITVSAAVAGDLGLAAGNLIGGWRCRPSCW
jgi:hypothetical protein